MEKITVPTSSNTNNKQLHDKKIIDKTYRCTEDKLSIVSVVCRICYDDNKQEQIITPCLCKGTVAFVHRSCLETWLAESNTTSCELCHYVYQTERTPKFTAKQSIWRWFRYRPQNIGFQIRGLRSDLLACALLTPLAVVITYVCLFSADYYNQQKFANIPAARWTSISLLIMIAIMLVGYYLWVYMVIRYHGRVWYYCWQRECIVRYIPPSEDAFTQDNEDCYNENVEDNETGFVASISNEIINLNELPAENHHNLINIQANLSDTYENNNTDVINGVERVNILHNNANNLSNNFVDNKSNKNEHINEIAILNINDISEIDNQNDGINDAINISQNNNKQHGSDA